MLQLVPKSMASCCWGSFAATWLPHHVNKICAFFLIFLQVKWSVKAALVSTDLSSSRSREQWCLEFRVLHHCMFSSSNVECAPYILDINDNTPIIHPTHPGHQQQYQRRHQWHHRWDQTRRQWHQWHQLNNVLVATLKPIHCWSIDLELWRPGSWKVSWRMSFIFPVLTWGCGGPVMATKRLETSAYRSLFVVNLFCFFCWLDDFPRSGRDGCYHPETGDSWRTVSPTLFAKESKEVDLRFMKRNLKLKQHWPIAVRCVRMVAIFEKNETPDMKSIFQQGECFGQAKPESEDAEEHQDGQSEGGRFGTTIRTQNAFATRTSPCILPS